ncbi:serpentine type 7TM GPCR chemoreceptor srt domain-containing protein [Ditylenchus destructor]|uniref:Serpentine type 7TM GPCR chemoreceptor srt domain-containing protein n=1 Tax=Ditylenchus destructor TaxID=166010 RepID=A0AAD4MU91_9BILA|nr:serpentine type 7TM GPCR chemoreceptor srt domain-containing protein [Ditylenchus destructor]
MSLYTIIFNHEEFLRYYNCSTYDVNDIPVDERSQVWVGFLYICIGIFIEVIYLPCIWAIWRLINKRDTECYRLMFILGVIDCVSILNNAFLIGHSTIAGDMFCSKPAYMLFRSITGNSLWLAGNYTIVLLAANRCWSLLEPFFKSPRIFHSSKKDNDSRKSNRFQGVKRTLAWLILPVAGTLFILCTSPLYYFNAIDANYYTGYQAQANWFILISIVAIYAVFLLCFGWMISQTGISAFRNTKRLSRNLNIFLQVLITSAFSVLCALGFIYVHIFAELSHIHFALVLIYQGTPAMIYLCLNRGIRRTILEGLLLPNFPFICNLCKITKRSHTTVPVRKVEEKFEVA